MEKFLSDWCLKPVISNTVLWSLKNFLALLSSFVEPLSYFTTSMIRPSWLRISFWMYTFLSFNMLLCSSDLHAHCLNGKRYAIWSAHSINRIHACNVWSPYWNEPKFSSLILIVLSWFISFGFASQTVQSDEAAALVTVRHTFYQSSCK